MLFIKIINKRKEIIGNTTAIENKISNKMSNIMIYFYPEI